MAQLEPGAGTAVLLNAGFLTDMPLLKQTTGRVSKARDEKEFKERRAPTLTLSNTR